MRAILQYYSILLNTTQYSSNAYLQGIFYMRQGRNACFRQETKLNDVLAAVEDIGDPFAHKVLLQSVLKHTMAMSKKLDKLASLMMLSIIKK